MRPRKPEVAPEDEARIAEALAAPVEVREKPPALDVKAVLARTPPSTLRPVENQPKRPKMGD